MSALRVLNIVLFVFAGLFSIFSFYFGISQEGMTVVEATWFSCAMFLGIIVTAYLAVAALILICIAGIWLLGKLIILFILGAVAGVIGGIFNLLGG